MGERVSGPEGCTENAEYGMIRVVAKPSMVTGTTSPGVETTAPTVVSTVAAGCVT